MADCCICKREVQTHRYLRAEPMRVERRGNTMVVTTPYQLKETGFYCLRHNPEEIEQSISEIYPPTDKIPVRLLWAPEPTVRLPHPFLVPQPQITASISHEAFLKLLENCARCGLLWSDDMHNPERFGIGVQEKPSSNGCHQVRTIVVSDKAGLHMALPQLIPPGTHWFVPHSVITPEEAVDFLIDTLGLDHPASEGLEALKEQVTNLGRVK